MQTNDNIHKYFEGDVQYPYADVGASELLHISEVTQENRRSFTYTCPYCKKGLRPRLGSKKAHCFAHKPGDCCELDRYIHKTAELLLKEKWERNEPFEITMRVRTECKDLKRCPFNNDCEYGCITEGTKTFDLKKYFTKCLLEKKIGEFIPDLCLIDETGIHDPIFIEIWSKHKNSDKKAHSGYRIIEIRLKTINDLEELPKYPITESESVSFSHFKTIFKNPTGDGPILMRYTLYADTLKSHVEIPLNCSNYRNNHNPKSVFEVVCNLNDIPKQRFHNYCNALAIDRGFNIRNCYLCQHFCAEGSNQASYDDELFNIDRPKTCLQENNTNKKISRTPEDAKTCQYFKLKDNMLSSLKAWYVNIDKYIRYQNEDGSFSEEIHKRKEYDCFDESNWGRSLGGLARFDWLDDH